MLCVAFNRKGKGHLTLVGEGGEAGAKWVLEAPGGGGGTLIYKLHKYVPWNRVWFLSLLVFK